MPYVVGAWVKVESGAGIQIGFGTKMRTYGPAPGWRYLEVTVPAPTAKEAPVMKCSGVVDCCYFGPADAHLNALALDPSLTLPLANMDEHGIVNWRVYDAQQNVVAEVGSGDKLTLHSRRYAVNLARALKEDSPPDAWPNSHIALTAQDGGKYLAVDPAPLKDKDRLQLFTTTRFPWRPDGAPPIGRAVRFRHQPAGSTCLDLSFGSALLQIKADSIRIVDPRGTGTFSGKAGSDEFLVVAIGHWLQFYAGSRLLISQEIQSPGQGSLSAAPGSPAVKVREVFEMYSPLMTISYQDGLGREIQTLTPHPNESGRIATQTLYDGWGQPAVTTRPLPVEWRAYYMPGLVKSYDWETGKLTGAVTDYYRGIYPDPEKEDADYACTRIVRERSPQAREVEVTRPGKRFAPGSHSNLRTVYMDTGDAHACFDRLKLERPEAWRTVTRYYPQADGSPAATVELLDQLGDMVARGIGAGNDRLVSTQRTRRQADGTAITYMVPPNLFGQGLPDVTAPGVTQVSSDYLGRIARRNDPDSGKDERLYDDAGRVRCYLEADGASRSPQRFYYRCYDVLGRQVEAGFCEQKWDEATFRARVKADRMWPSKEGGVTWLTRWFYDTDVSSPGTADVFDANGRLREVQERASDGKVATERYYYDPLGRVARVEQIVPYFDDKTRSTQYKYDTLNRIGIVHYPVLDSPRFICYIYNTAGLLGKVGEAGAPDRYARYAYTPDGNVLEEHRNANRIHGFFSYDSSGNLVGREYKNENQEPLLRETLEYAGGVSSALASVTFNASRATPRGHRYRFQYTPTNRLVNAHTEPGPGLEVIGRWDLTGVKSAQAEIDRNGNLVGRREGPTLAATYQANSNRMETFAEQDRPLRTLSHDAGGRLTRIEPHHTIRYHGLRTVPETVESHKGVMQLRYDGAGRRVVKQWQTGKKLYTHGLSPRPLAERTATGETLYVYGLGGPLAVLEGAKTSYVLSDHLGSTRLVLESDGKERGHFNYTPFGGLQVDNSSALKDAPIPYLFTGQEYDAELDLYNYRARYYDPMLGRFHCPDPAGQWFSPYAYVGNNPANLVDPSGQVSFGYRLAMTLAYTGLGALAGAVAGTLVAGVGWLAGGNPDFGEYAKWGAVAGAAYGFTRGTVEGIVGLIRNAEVRGGVFLLVLFFGFLWVLGRIPSGRVGAEILAEGAGLPRAQWGLHLVDATAANFAKMNREVFFWPAELNFDGRLIIVGHGAASTSRVELGLNNPNGGVLDTAQNVFDLIPDNLRRQVNRVDLSVCYAERNGFAADLRGLFNPNGGAAIPVRAARGKVSPMGAWTTMGTVYERGWGGEIATWTFGYPFGRRVF